MAVRALPVCLAACLFLANARAQVPADKPQFEVASVKPGNPESHIVRSVITPGGHLRAGNVTLRILIEDAFQLKPFQLSDGPRWIDDEKFEVLANAAESAGPDHVRLMLQALLEDRFRLVLKRESKEQVVSYLTAKDPLKPKVTPSKEGTRQTMVIATSGDGLNRVRFTGTTMERLADILSRQMGHMVLDRTGLNGPFDFQLDATHDQSEPNPFIAPFGPSLGQLGLQLATGKSMVEFFTVERVEKPSAN